MTEKKKREELIEHVEELKEAAEQTTQMLKEFRYDDAVARGLFLLDVKTRKANKEKEMVVVSDADYIKKMVHFVKKKEKANSFIYFSYGKCYVDLLRTPYDLLPPSIKNKYVEEAKESLFFAERGMAPTTTSQKLAKAFYRYFNERHHKARTLSVLADADDTNENEVFELGNGARLQLIHDAQNEEKYAIYRDEGMLFHKLGLRQGACVLEGKLLGMFVKEYLDESINPFATIRVKKLQEGFEKWDAKAQEALKKPFGGSSIPSIYEVLDERVYGFARRAIARQKRTLLEKQEEKAKEEGLSQ